MAKNLIQLIIDFFVSIFNSIKKRPSSSSGTSIDPSGIDSTVEVGKPVVTTFPSSDGTYRVGVFLEPTQLGVTEPLFQEFKKNGITDIAFRVSNSGKAGWVYTKAPTVIELAHKYGIRLLGWTWALDGGFQYTKEFIDMGADGIVLDFESYDIYPYLDYFKSVKTACGNKEFIVCMKADGWDGGFAYNKILEYADYIMPMLYIGDYHVTVSDLTKWVKYWYEKYPGRFMACLESYISDENTTPKSEASILEEADAVINYVVAIFFFIAGLLNYSGGIKKNNTTTPVDTEVPSTSNTSWKGEDWLQFEKNTRYVFESATEIAKYIINYLDYSYYLDDQLTFKQEMDRKLNYLNCVDMAQALGRILSSGGYKVRRFSVYCPTYQVSHAILLVSGHEFTDEVWFDGAAMASDNYGIDQHWCNGEIRENPSWFPAE